MWAINRKVDDIVAGFEECEIPVGDILSEMQRLILEGAATEAEAFRLLARVAGD